MAVGIRSLSADYLVRVSGIVHAGAGARSKPRRARLGILAASLFGGPPAHAGFAFVSRMMRRDWQFRRQLVPMLFPLVFGFGGMLVEGWHKDPFSPAFSPLHLFPHFFGFTLFFVCNMLAYSSDYKGAWIFQLAPLHALDGFAGGVFALLWMGLIVIPHLLVMPVLVWAWGPAHGLLFILYSLAAASFYLSLEIRAVPAAPFSQQVNPARGASSLAVLMVGGLGVAIAVGVQYVLLFRWPAVLAGATLVLALAACFLGRKSIEAYAVAIRHNLGIESGGLYREVDA